MTAALRWLPALALLLLPAGLLRGNIIGPAVPLDQLTSQSDVIFQGTAVSSKAVDDPAFPSYLGSIVQETEFRPAWPIKGMRTVHDIKFRHYARDPQPSGMMDSPQSYEFEIGKSYLIFAKQPSGSPPDVCQQLWMSPIGMQDEGVLLCFRSFPFSSRESMQDVFWQNLTGLLKSSDPKEVIYAINHLDAFSGSLRGFGNFGALSEFQRLDVLAAVRGFIGNPNPDIAQAAVGLMGSHNPYMDRQQAENWLATVGSARNDGYAPRDRNMVNEGGMLYWRDLAAVVDSKADAATRAMAVSALGLVREPSLQDSVQRWLGDPSPAVRNAATLLLADYPALATHDRLDALAKDPLPDIRISTCFVIGFAQQTDSLDLLFKLLTDADKKVRATAATCLLSFAPTDPRIEKVFRDNLANPEFGPLFVVALARINPSAYLDPLTHEVETKDDPTNWSGGTIPAYTASRLLYKFLEAQSLADLQAGKFDRQFDALEIQNPNHDVDPQFVYSLELRSGLTGRAKKYRAMIDKTTTYDVETFFKRADADPKMYDYSD